MKIKGITLIIDGQDFNITIDEAKELHAELNRLFDAPKHQVFRDPFDPLNKPFEVTCGTVGNPAEQRSYTTSP